MKSLRGRGKIQTCSATGENPPGHKGLSPRQPLHLNGWELSLLASESVQFSTVVESVPSQWPECTDLVESCTLLAAKKFPPATESVELSEKKRILLVAESVQLSETEKILLAAESVQLSATKRILLSI
ncbi:uncharacterized protein PGTG_13711 [Puccinia graminis f. sp. tritici CRL 75-36-700-3]|uniref:Uncharacterized protein n=1 Tax=Puccinia graminis f. sp. tritici (strain CRL 75-36-700-3 / race SCCL) TaxID=418459 RepID=E3KSV3_PUCGT|nr:uncharacterized protein PGTG_13711 [Puccinia graminis f. sp. tritici CRL 75-36-700-3]EFP87483.1 hypothetical protein PGTG_13711 [Puccinia graminis f. sp. tritici CRL 75-36-700-3]